MRILIVQILPCALAVLLGSCAVGAQSTKNLAKSAQKAFEKAEMHFRQGQFVESEKAYLKVIESEPQYLLAKVRLGALYFDQGHYEQSEKYFRQVLDNEPDKYPLIYYKLGEIAWLSERYDSVSLHLNQFLDTGNGSTELRSKATKYIRDADFIMSLGSRPSVEIKPLSRAINTDVPEYLPSLPATDAFMVFTRRVRGQEDFFISHRHHDSWLLAKPIQELNTLENEGAHSVSADGKMLIFTACARRDGLGSCDLYYSLHQGGTWTKPRNMGPTINSKYWDGQPTISANGLTLYFASSRPGGSGGRDLWSADRTANGWTQPINLTSLNTSDNDESPFLHLDGSSLYFMSEGHPGYGGSDLFMSKLKGEIWSTPINLGAPLNSSADEGALHIDIAGTTGYFARETSQEGARDIDIYQFPIPESLRPTPATYAVIRVVDGITKDRLQGIVEVYDLDQKKSFIRTYTDATGELLVCLTAGKDYAIHAQKKGYTFFSTHINLKEGNDQLSPYQLDALLFPAGDSKEASDSVEPIILENVFFASGRAEILSASFHELNKLFQLMNENQKMIIELQGHTDNVGSTEDNELLSTARAQAIYDFLAQKGVSTQRMTYRGLGEHSPLTTNETEAGRQKNRRTEFIITHR